MYNDMDFDALLDRVRTLEGQVGDLITEVARLRSVDPSGRLGDLEYRVRNIEADNTLQEVSRKVDALIGLVRTRGVNDHSPDPLPGL